ncbi:MAG TPA: PKD domain-containing protein [Gaiella sp.]|nr:PKD domain-containing protein [Gaiella sp.]
MRGDECAAAIRPINPVASFVAEPAEPAAGEPIRLLDLSYDPAGDGIALHAWDFGDGSTSLERRPTHSYTRDGAYTVTLHVTARDGRVGVASLPVTVTTHDIGVARVETPQRARAGKDGRVVVVVGSRHRAEIAQVELFRQRGVRAWESVGIQTRPIPHERTVDVPFTVSFDDEDAEVGHVTFGARATLVGANDASPDDNALTASPTIVVRRKP